MEARRCLPFAGAARLRRKPSVDRRSEAAGLRHERAFHQCASVQSAISTGRCKRREEDGSVDELPGEGAGIAVLKAVRSSMVVGRWPKRSIPGPRIPHLLTK